MTDTPDPKGQSANVATITEEQRKAMGVPEKFKDWPSVVKWGAEAEKAKTRAEQDAAEKGKALEELTELLSQDPKPEPTPVASTGNPLKDEYVKKGVDPVIADTIVDATSRSVAYMQAELAKKDAAMRKVEKQAKISANERAIQAQRDALKGRIGDAAYAELQDQIGAELDKLTSEEDKDLDGKEVWRAYVLAKESKALDAQEREEQARLAAIRRGEFATVGGGTRGEEQRDVSKMSAADTLAEIKKLGLDKAGRKELGYDV